MNEFYVSPLSSRYASEEMQRLFSPYMRIYTWRRLWIALAEAQKELGLAISQEQIEELKSNCETIDFERAAVFEKQLGHDVMAHIKLYAELCPKAAPLIHLGATSCYVTDNGDLILMKAALELLESKVKKLLQTLKRFAKKHASLAALSYTHLQPAQPTTYGKRATLWMQDFLLDLEEIQRRKEALPFLGAKGATGTQASFLLLFEGEEEKVKKLDHLIAKKMGFTKELAVSGQTYPRKLDILLLDTLSSFAASAHKMANDIRLLCHLKEIEEPFENEQVGSSAMPHKRNPILSERICSLARFLFSLAENPRYTAALQWLERSLDDSANRRLALPEAFLTADALVSLLLHLTEGLTVFPHSIEKNLQEELPFLATEVLLMALVKKGKNRHQMHARLKDLSHKASKKVKQGQPHDLLKDILDEEEMGFTKEEFEQLLKLENFTGRATAQVNDFINDIKD